MDRTELEKRYNRICTDIGEGRIRSALEKLSHLLRNAPGADYYYKLENISENYQSLLKYSYDEYHDPEQEEILKKISASVLSLADEVRQIILEKAFLQKKLERAFLLREFGEDPQAVLERLDELLSEKELQQILKESGTQGAVTRPVDKLFSLIWLTGKLSEEMAARLRKAASSDNLEWHEKCLIVSALTISLLNEFDLKKVLLLVEFIEVRQDQVYERALTGLVLALIRYDQRIRFFPEIEKALQRLSSREKIRHDLETLVLQLLMAQETEKITKEFEEEVLPEMKKIMPKLEDKLQIDPVAGDDDMEGKNPGWKDMIEEVPGLFERIEKFTRMQMEGGDVFMSTFSLLKRFDFFRKMSNWVEPFYADHPDLKNAQAEDEQFFSRLLEGLGRAFYLCNSDKYSFALNFSAVPQQQRSMLVTYFEAELEQMKELVSEEERLNPETNSNAIFIQYIQDLYRFFKLYPHRHEFDDIFQEKILFSKLDFYKKHFENPPFTEKLASFCFEKKHYPEAIELYKFMLDRQPASGVWYEKTGYAFQQTGDYEQALEYYRKAELFEGDRLWILKKMGWCAMKAGKYDQAASFFLEAAKVQPDDLGLQARIAHCYVKMKDFQTAIRYYAKAVFYQPDDLKVMRPLAFCYFATGNPQEASGYYDKILSSGSPAPFDFMNAGHVQLCLKNRGKALELYKSCFNDLTLNSDSFLEAFTEDVPFLVSNGLNPNEIPLIIDHILYNSGSIYTA